MRKKIEIQSKKKKRFTFEQMNNEKPNKKKVEGEWTLRRTLIRIIAYPFCLFLIVFGIYMVLNSKNSRSLMAGTGAVIIAAIYLFLDLRILIYGDKD